MDNNDSNSINLGNVLNKLTTPMEKTASDNTDQGGSAGTSDEQTNTEKFAQSLSKTASADGKTDTADATPPDNKDQTEPPTGSPVDGLQKYAEDIADMEHNTMVKEAQVFGAVMADSFAGRLAEIQEAVGTQPADDGQTKVASTTDNGEIVYKDLQGNGYTQSDLEKAAALKEDAETQYMEKVAVDKFNTLTEEEVEEVKAFQKFASEKGENLEPFEAFCKLAEYAAQQGYEDTMVKVGEEAKAEGYMDTMEKVAGILKDQGETEAVQKLEKFAYDKGVTDCMEKVAFVAGSHGYSQTEALLKKHVK